MTTQTLTTENIEAAVESIRDLSDYQSSLLHGTQRWSGSDLRGEASRWSSSYLRTRVSLVKLIERAGFAAKTVYEGPKGIRRLLVTRPEDGASCVVGA